MEGTTIRPLRRYRCRMVLRKTDPVRTTGRNGSPPSFARPFLTLAVRLRCIRPPDFHGYAKRVEPP